MAYNLKHFIYGQHVFSFPIMTTVWMITFISILCGHISADVRFVCPQPVSPRSDLLMDSSSVPIHPQSGGKMSTTVSTSTSSTTTTSTTLSPASPSPQTTTKPILNSVSTKSPAQKESTPKTPESVFSESPSLPPKGGESSNETVQGSGNGTSNVEQSGSESVSDTPKPAQVEEKSTVSSTRVKREAQDDDSQVSQGLICATQDFQAAHTSDVYPGLMTITFEETRFIQDSPFRLSLVQVEDEQNKTSILTQSGCLLMDFIPHNNHIVITEKCKKKKNEYPLGVCEDSKYRLTIKIPDVQCDSCILMLQQVIPKQDGGVCDMNSDNATGACQTYVSCARVKLRPTPFGVNKTMSDCANYLDNLPGDWPHRPQELYQTEDGNALKLDLKHSRLNLEVFKNKKLNTIDRLEILHGSSVIWNTTSLDKQQSHDKTVKASWDNLSSSETGLLKANELVLNVVGSKESFASEIHFDSIEFRPGHLSGLHDLYSYSGWLVSRHYLGTEAGDPVVALPAGPCAPRARSFVSVLQSIHVQSHGIVGITILEDRAYITAVLHTEKEVVKTVTLSGPDLVGIQPIVLKAPANFLGVLQFALDISSQLTFIDTAGFLTTVAVTTDKEEDVLVGDLEEGMYAILRDTSGEVHGMAALQPTQGKWIQVQLVLTAHSAAPVIVSSILSGPQTVLLDLTREKLFCLPHFICVETFVHDVSTDMLLYLTKGLAFLYVTTESSQLTGQVTGVTNKYCEASSGGCFGMEQPAPSPATVGHVRGSQTTAFALDRANVLHFSVLTQEVAWAGDNQTVVLKKDQEDLSDPVSLRDLHSLTHTKVASGQFPMYNSLDLLLRVSTSRSSSLELVTLDDGQPVFTQPLPQLSRVTCTHSKTIEVGKEDPAWLDDSDLPKELFAVERDYIKFVLDNGTDFYMMRSSAHSGQCEFTEADRLVPQHHVHGFCLYIQQLDHHGVYFFSDQPRCNSSHPARLVVHVVTSGPSMLDSDHDEWCQHSMYSVWRSNLLAKWEEPSISGPILIGLLVGLCTAGFFIIWHSIRVKRGDSGFTSSSSNVFVRF